MARLVIGLVSSLMSFSKSGFEMLGMNVLGSNDGTDAMASTLPLAGSTTTAAPRPTERIASSVIAWMRASMVR